MGDDWKTRLTTRKNCNRLPRTSADSCLGIVIGAFVLLAILNIGFRLYIAYPIPSREKPVLKGDCFWDKWRVKRYLRSWGIRAEAWLEEGIVPVAPIACYEYDRTCSLDLRGENIDTLEWCDGLDIVSLDVSGTRVSDIGPLVCQTNLVTLKLDNTLVDDLSPLAKWAENTGRTNPRLYMLSIRNTKVTDLSPLKEIDIERLYLDGSPCHDLSPIRTNTLAAIYFSFLPGPGMIGTEHIRACTNVYVNWMHPSHAWALFDYFYSGKVDQSRYATIRSPQVFIRTLEREFEARTDIPTKDAEKSLE